MWVKAKALDRAIYGLCLLAPWSLLWLDSSLLYPYATGKVWLFRSIVELAFALSIYRYVATSAIKTYSLGKSAAENVFLAILLGFLIWTALCNYFGIDSGRSFWSNYERMAGLLAYLHWAMYFIALRWVMNADRSRGVLLNLVLVILCVSLLSYFETDKRAISTLGNPIYLGNLACFGLFLCGCLWADKLRQASSKKLAYRLMALLVCAVMLGTMFNAASRSAFLALAIGGMGLGFILLWNSRRVTRRLMVSVIVGVVVLFGLALTQLELAQEALKQADSYALQRIGKISSIDQTTVDRLENWRIAMDAAEQYPLMGWGQENYMMAYIEHYRAGVMDFAKTWFDRAHNAYLDVLLASGLIGLLLYGVMLLLPIFIVMRSTQWSTWQKAFLVGFFLAFISKNIVGFDTFSSTLIWLSLTAIVVSKAKVVDQVSPIDSHPYLKIIALLFVISLSISYIYNVNLKHYQYNQQIATMLDSRRENPKRNFEPWLDALKQAPRMTINAQLAVLTQGLSQWPDTSPDSTEPDRREQMFQYAGQLINTELVRQPRNYRVKHNAGLLLMNRGHAELASELFKDLVSTSPQRTIFWANLARSYKQLDQDELAAQSWQQAEKLNPKWTKLKRHN